MSTVYKQEPNHPNWTGRVPRQSRITGAWAEQRSFYAEQRIPLVAYVVGLLAVVLICVAAYL